MDTTATLALTLAAALAGGLLGEYQRRRLNTLHYRYPDETPEEWPLPGRRYWVPAVLALILGLLTWRYLSQDQAVHLFHLIPLAIAAPWLAAIDADVHRLPYRTTLLTLTLSAVGLITTSALTQPWTPLIAGVLGWAIAHGLFWALHKIGGGNLGYGDVRLAGLIALTTTPLSAWTPWLAFLIGTLTASAWALTHRRRPQARHAYGPWLLLGWTVSLLCV